MPEFGVAVKAIIKKDGKYLIIRKSKDEDVTPNTIDIPGGRIEFGEEPEDALKREVKEEVGLDVTIIGPIKTWNFKTKDDFQLVGITFLCETEGGNVTLSDEHTEYHWKTHDELKEIGLPSWSLKEFELAEKHLLIL